MPHIKIIAHRSVRLRNHTNDANHKQSKKAVKDAFRSVVEIRAWQSWMPT